MNLFERQHVTNLLIKWIAFRKDCTIGDSVLNRIMDASWSQGVEPAWNATCDCSFGCTCDVSHTHSIWKNRDSILDKSIDASLNTTCGRSPLIVGCD